MTEEPYRSPTFTVSLVTAEALTALRAKNVTTRDNTTKPFFMEPPQAMHLDEHKEVC